MSGAKAQKSDDQTRKAETMTPRERFIAALERRSPPGRVPHFELVFFLTMETFGRVHPQQRNYGQWKQMSEHERELHRRDQAQIFVDIAERFEHDAIFLHSLPHGADEYRRVIEYIREISGDKYYIMIHGDPTIGIPGGDGMLKLSLEMKQNPQKVIEAQKRAVACALEDAEKLRVEGGLDGFALCSDYCFNSGPFISPAMFDEFITPFLIEVVRGYREMGYYVIKHTDGNIMPILDRLLEARPHALHSLDPQGGVDMAEVVRLAGDQVCLCGNVDCGLMQTGTEAQVIESARYALEEGKKAPGYIFSTSNCIYTGMELKRYELILDVWRQEGVRA